jgi:hypothetical protein
MDVAVIEIKSRGLFPFGEPRHGGNDEGPSNIQVLLSLVGVALTLVGGYRRLFSRDEAHQHVAPGRLSVGRGQKLHPVRVTTGQRLSQ